MTLETLYLNEGIKVSVETKWAGLSNCLVRRAVWWNGETQTVFEKPYDDNMTDEEFVHTAVSRYAASILQEVNNERGGGLTNDAQSVEDIWYSYQRITHGGGNAPFCNIEKHGEWYSINTTKEVNDEREF